MGLEIEEEEGQMMKEQQKKKKQDERDQDRECEKGNCYHQSIVVKGGYGREKLEEVQREV